MVVKYAGAKRALM